MMGHYQRLFVAVVGIWLLTVTLTVPLIAIAKLYYRSKHQATLPIYQKLVTIERVVWKSLLPTVMGVWIMILIQSSL